jgi:hypothetical protein
MGLFDGFSFTDVASNLNVTVGGETYENVLTDIGSVVGSGWAIAGSIGDKLTEDVTIDIDDMIDGSDIFEEVEFGKY